MQERVAQIEGPERHKLFPAATEAPWSPAWDDWRRRTVRAREAPQNLLGNETTGTGTGTGTGAGTGTGTGTGHRCMIYMFTYNGLIPLVCTLHLCCIAQHPVCRPDRSVNKPFSSSK